MKTNVVFFVLLVLALAFDACNAGDQQSGLCSKADGFLEAMKILAAEHKQQLSAQRSACLKEAKNCKDLLDAGMTADGVYTILPDDQAALEVYCDQTTDGGGWTVLQRRVSPFSTSFNRKWEEYRCGFGNLTGEFWLGNDNIHRLAANVSFRVDFHEGGNKLYAKYENFVVAGADDKYRWNMDSYSGTLANAIYGRTWHKWHVELQMQFSTPDNDNDGCRCQCAHSSGWWYNWCGLANLNHHTAPQWIKHVSSTTWRWGSFSEMKIRPSSQ